MSISIKQIALHPQLYVFVSCSKIHIINREIRGQYANSHAYVASATAHIGRSEVFIPSRKILDDGRVQDIHEGQ